LEVGIDASGFERDTYMMKHYKIFKDIHFHTGLFISPFILAFAISALVMNHHSIDWQEDWQEWYFSVNEKVDQTVDIEIPSSDKNRMDFAKNILEQLNVSGEIAGIFGDSIQMYIPVTLPGHRYSIKADLIAGKAYINSSRTNIWKKLIWLHKMPGPHNASIRGNWIKTKIWGSAVDLFVICLLFSSLTGIVLWYYLKQERTIGIIALIIGLVSIALLIIGLKN
jgi:hypothetical protein